MANQIVVSAGAKVRNLQDVIIGTSGVLTSLGFDVANGVPRLDVNGKILVSQLPNSVMEYKGTWNAATNTPTLVNGTGNQGDVYLCNVAGTVNFGAGPIAFVVGDQVIYSGSIWQRASGATGTVTSVALTESGDSLNITGSPITTSGTINIGFNGTNLQYVNGAGNLTTFPTLITSIGLSMPSAFSVANSPLTANGTIAVTGAGVASQYIRGDGTLADFPSSGGGGSSVSYYLNGGTSQGTIGGVTYYEMSKTADTGTGVDFTKTGDGFIVAFLTDANDPAQLNIPAGNWNYEIYASMSANGGTPEMYAELYVYDGTTFTLISTSPHEILYDGTALNLYTFAMAVPATSLTLTDRLAVKLYATNSGGKTTTIHTQDGHLCQIITTFSTGITALNGLTAQVQYFQVGTSGTDFNISSTTATHTFNLPTASAANRGALSSADWTIFNGKQPQLNGTGFVKASGTTITYDNSTYYLASNPSAFIALTALSAGTGISYNNTTGVITNSAPDQTVSLTAGAGISVSGSYPSFTIASTITQYTDALSRAALSFAAGSGAYNSTTGVITIPTDNSQIANGAGYITSSALSGYLPLAGGTLTGALYINYANPVLRFKGATLDGYIINSSDKLYIADYNTATKGMTVDLSTGALTQLGSGAVTLLGALGGTSATFSNTTDVRVKTIGTTNLSLYESANTSGSLYVGIDNSTGSGFGVGNYSRVIWSSGTGYPLIFATQDVERMRIWGSTGNVNIGTTPASDSGYKLDVNGTGRFSSYLNVNYQLTAANGSINIESVDPSLRFRVTGGSANKRIYEWRAIAAGTIYDYLQLRLWNDAQNSATELLGIAAAGAATFSIPALSANTYVSNVNFTDNTNNTGHFGIIRNSTSGNGAFYGADGIVELYTNMSGTNVKALSLSITGAATFSSSVTATSFFESSDSRLKTLIQDNYQTKGIASITPKLYTKNGKVELGYYAQDFVGILDSAVSKGSDDMLSLSYREVLVAKVYALEQEIKDLKAKMN